MENCKNYLVLNGGEPICLPDELAERICKACERENSGARLRLSEIEIGDTFKTGDTEFVVLEQSDGKTYVITKEIIGDSVKFGDSNNYSSDGCEVRKRVEEFQKKLETLIGADNFIEHTLDLTSDDGLEDYGSVNVKASLLTCDMYRKYVQILDKHKLGKWWWLATPYTTPTHEDAEWVRCVAPSGIILRGTGYYSDRGVRPFCILKSNIFVSK